MDYPIVAPTLIQFTNLVTACMSLVESTNYNKFLLLRFLIHSTSGPCTPGTYVGRVGYEGDKDNLKLMISPT